MLLVIFVILLCGAFAWLNLKPEPTPVEENPEIRRIVIRDARQANEDEWRELVGSSRD